MSVENKATSAFCASCDTTATDDIRLMKCDGCDLVKYCSDECQRNHKPEHEEVCKERVADLRDELLFKQPEGSHMGDCPICSLPLPLEMDESTINNCCSKTICNGCAFANKGREIRGGLVQSCPFCREPLPLTMEGAIEQRMKRVEANDPNAIRQEGGKHDKKGDYSKAFEYFAKAAELGDAEAHYKLSFLYREGKGVEEDWEKEIHHLEEAAIGGHPKARYNLGCHELNNNYSAERAVKHWIIAARQGDDKSIKQLMKMFKGELMGKEDLTATLRAHQNALNEMKSPQRNKAEDYRLWESRWLK